MLDINLLRKDLAQVIARLERRETPQPFLDVARFTALESERKTIQTRTEELQARRNSLSKQIGQSKAKGEDASDIMAGLDGFHRQAVEILRSDRVRSALDLGRERDTLRDDYGRTSLGQGALAARRLIEAGARFVTLGVTTADNTNEYSIGINVQLARVVCRRQRWLRLLQQMLECR